MVVEGASAVATALEPPPPMRDAGLVEVDVRFEGAPPVMRVPKTRLDADGCKDEPLVHDAVKVDRDGRVADAIVWLEPPGGFGEQTLPPPPPLEIHDAHCQYQPRAAVTRPGGEILFFNESGTLMNVHAYRGEDSPINQAQPRGADPLRSTHVTQETGIVALRDDVHPWMHGFLVVTEATFAGVTGDKGKVTFVKVPRGRYRLHVWHAIFGEKVLELVVPQEAGSSVRYSPGSGPPPENPAELDGLW